MTEAGLLLTPASFNSEKTEAVFDWTRWLKMHRVRSCAGPWLTCTTITYTGEDGGKSICESSSQPGVCLHLLPAYCLTALPLGAEKLRIANSWGLKAGRGVGSAFKLTGRADSAPQDMFCSQL